jgi:hypothetical protein
LPSPFRYGTVTAMEEETGRSGREEREEVVESDSERRRRRRRSRRRKKGKEPNVELQRM